MIDLKKIQERFDNYFKEETLESFEDWLDKKRLDDVLRDVIELIDDKYFESLLNIATKVISIKEVKYTSKSKRTTTAIIADTPEHQCQYAMAS